MKIETAAKQIGSGAASLVANPRAVGRLAGVILVVFVALVLVNKFAAGYTPEAVANRI